MEERRRARIGTVSGLALLTGGTAVAAVAGGAHSIFATIALGLLTIGMGHALAEEITRQARRGPSGGWVMEDYVNTVLLAAWSLIALGLAALPTAPPLLRIVGGVLTVAYAGICAAFVRLKRRALRDAARRAAAHPDHPYLSPSTRAN